METLHSIIGMILAGLAIYISICVVWYIILAVANWKIFSKAGEEGWKSLIPFLNSYVIFKIKRTHRTLPMRSFFDCFSF